MCPMRLPVLCALCCVFCALCSVQIYGHSFVVVDDFSFDSGRLLQLALQYAPQVRRAQLTIMSYIPPVNCRECFSFLGFCTERFYFVNNMLPSFCSVVNSFCRPYLVTCASFILCFSSCSCFWECSWECS